MTLALPSRGWWELGQGLCEGFALTAVAIIITMTSVGDVFITTSPHVLVEGLGCPRQFPEIDREETFQFLSVPALPSSWSRRPGILTAPGEKEGHTALPFVGLSAERGFVH